MSWAPQAVVKTELLRMRCCTTSKTMTPGGAVPSAAADPVADGVAGIVTYDTGAPVARWRCTSLPLGDGNIP